MSRKTRRQTMSFTLPMLERYTSISEWQLPRERSGFSYPSTFRHFPLARFKTLRCSRVSAVPHCPRRPTFKWGRVWICQLRAKSQPGDVRHSKLCSLTLLVTRQRVCVRATLICIFLTARAAALHANYGMFTHTATLEEVEGEHRRFAVAAFKFLAVESNIFSREIKWNKVFLHVSHAHDYCVTGNSMCPSLSPLISNITGAAATWHEKIRGCCSKGGPSSHAGDVYAHTAGLPTRQRRTSEVMHD